MSSSAKGMANHARTLGCCQEKERPSFADFLKEMQVLSQACQISGPFVILN